MAIEPTLQEVFEAASHSRITDIHVSLPAVIVSYDPTTQTATVQPVVKRPIPTDDGETVFEQLAQITNVRVAWPRGGGYSIQWPLNPGDHGELVFTQWDPSGWRENGQITEPALLQLHGLSQPWFWPGAGTSPLTPPVGDEAVFEIGTLLRLGGLTADFVALSGKVDTALAALAAFESSVQATLTGGIATVSGGAGTFTVPLVATAPTPAPTGATKVKAE